MEFGFAIVAAACCALAPIGVAIAWLFGRDTRNKSVSNLGETVPDEEASRRGQ